jgi:RHH-type transcriptional regulator, rel operon repressor / antitoxin RelB
MSETKLITVRIPSEVAQKLDALAVSTDRSKSYLAAQAIEEYIETQEWQIKSIKEGIESAEAGEILEHSKVSEWVKSWGTDDEKDIPS